MSLRPIQSGSLGNVHAHDKIWLRQAAIHSPTRSEFALKLYMLSLFLPEGTSFFIGDFRVSPARAVLIALFLPAISRFIQRAGSPQFVLVPSDLIAAAAGVWMILAETATEGVADGLKSAGVLALEFTGSYYVFRSLLGPTDSSVRVIKFGCKILIIVIAVALLDPLTGRVFTHEFINQLTGYVKAPFDYQSESVVRDGLVRAMGPLETSILFGVVCAWFGILALGTFGSRLFGKIIAASAFVGIWFSGSRGPLLAYVIGLVLVAVYYPLTKKIATRWRVLVILAASWIAFVFCYSNYPVGTLLKYCGMDPSSAWYREAIWQAAGPLVLDSPVFGLGMFADWGWENNDLLTSGTVDAVWLAVAMMFGIPGSLLVAFTTASASWLGAVDTARYLTPNEQRLSVSLGVVVAITIFLGFTVHFWGAC